MKKNRSLICLLGWRSSAVENVPWQMLLDLVNCLQSSGWGERLSPLPGPRKPSFTPLGPLMSARLPWAVICSLETKKKKNVKSEWAESPPGWASSCYKQPVFELVIMSHGAPSLVQKWLILSKLSVLSLLPNARISHSVYLKKGTVLLKEQDAWKESELHGAFQMHGPKSSSGQCKPSNKINSKERRPELPLPDKLPKFPEY